MESPTTCQGTWRVYFGPTDGQVPEGAEMLRCDGCGELAIINKGNWLTLVPGTPSEDVS